MDPVTHAVIGMSIAKLTGNHVALTDIATAAIVIGSVFPDADILLQKWGDYIYLKNHRGITHSILGLTVSSLFIAGILGALFHDSHFLYIFAWAFLGCLSHSFFDLFNCYGAKLLWPLNKKKFSLGLLIVFDPAFLGILTGYIFTNGLVQYIFQALFVLYLLSRVAMREIVRRDIISRYGQKCNKVHILPSLTGLLRWHFVLEEEDCNIVGEANLPKRSIKIVRRLYKLADDAMDKAMFSHVGEFFSEFTPLFHVTSEKTGENTRYVFTDMRYYMRRNFLHHAILELDDNGCVVKSSFNPYSMNRSVEI